MKKFPKIKRIGDSINDGILEADPKQLVVQEKLDGANFRFVYHGEEDRLVFGSRNIEYWNDGNQPITSSDRRWFTINSYLNKLPYVDRKTCPQNDVDKSFRHAMEYVKESVDLDAIKRIDNKYGELTFFGEAMHSHTIDYDWETTPSFIGFAIYSDTLGQFLTAEDTESIYQELGFNTPRTHNVTVIEDGFDCPDSEYYDGPAEGVIIRNEVTEQVAKVRGEKFREMHSGSRSTTPEEYEPSDGKLLAHKFATEARILKEIHKAENRGETIEMAMMERLWRNVFDDIIEEEYETIFLGNHELGTKDFRSEVASKTTEVLQQYLNRPADSVLNEATA